MKFTKSRGWLDGCYFCFSIPVCLVSSLFQLLKQTFFSTQSHIHHPGQTQQQADKYRKVNYHSMLERENMERKVGYEGDVIFTSTLLDPHPDILYSE